MARFRGRVKGQREAASRLGSGKSGLVAEANGWECGVRVRANAIGDVDHFDVLMTQGSDGVGSTLLGSVAGGKWYPMTPAYPEWKELAEELKAVADWIDLDDCDESRANVMAKAARLREIAHQLHYGDWEAQESEPPEPF